MHFCYLITEFTVWNTYLVDIFHWIQTQGVKTSEMVPCTWQEVSLNESGVYIKTEMLLNLLNGMEVPVLHS